VQKELVPEEAALMIPAQILIEIAIMAGTVLVPYGIFILWMGGAFDNLQKWERLRQDEAPWLQDPQTGTRWSR
jgi:hypothetical protein